MDGADLLHLLPETAPSANRTGLLVHDADRNGSGVLHIIPVELVANKGRLEGRHGMTRCGESGTAKRRSGGIRVWESSRVYI